MIYELSLISVAIIFSQVGYPCSRTQVFTRAALGCVSELQRSMTMNPDLSPAWVMAAARHYAPRLETLSHILLLQPQLATDILQQASHTKPTDMVRSHQLHHK